MIKLKHGNFYMAMWFLSGPGEDNDVMGFIWREADGKVRAKYRHRYYEGEDPWDDKDEKSWYEMSFNGEPDIAKFKGVWETAARYAGNDLDWTDINGDDQRAIELLKTKEWSHMREEAVH